MIMLRVSMVCATLLLATGCPKSEKAEAPAGSTPPPIQPTTAPTAAATPEERASAGHNKMANCPSSVPGAKTAIEETADGVVVTVTAQTEIAIKEIRERAEHLSDVATKAPDSIKHTGEGEGGGALGQCPVVQTDTSVKSEEVPGGAKMTVKPLKPENLPALKTLTKERSAKVAAEHP